MSASGLCGTHFPTSVVEVPPLPPKTTSHVVGQTSGGGDGGGNVGGGGDGRGGGGEGRGGGGDGRGGGGEPPNRSSGTTQQKQEDVSAHPTVSDTNASPSSAQALAGSFELDTHLPINGSVPLGIFLPHVAPGSHWPLGGGTGDGGDGGTGDTGGGLGFGLGVVSSIQQ